MKKNIVFGQPSIGKEEINYVVKVIRSKWIGSGKITELFENNLGTFKNESKKLLL